MDSYNTTTAAERPDEFEVVVVEDDDIDAELLHRLLRRIWPANLLVHRFRDVTSFERAMTCGDPAGRRPLPNVILTDLGLPDASGLDVVDRVKALAGDSPVIVLTGNTDPLIAEQSMQRGAQDFLVKGSFNLEALQRSVRYSIIRAGSEAQLKATTRELQAINAELDSFAGVVAHDLRAPVRTARLLADRLVFSIGSPDAEARVPDFAARLEGCLSRLEALIAGVLDQVSLRDKPLALEALSICDLVDTVRADLGADLEATGSELTCSDRTASSQPALVMADAVRMRQVLGNLVENSIKYRDPSRPNRITVSAERHVDQVVIRVSDNGIGIAAEYRDQVFSMFERLHTDADVPGLGLGLAMCSKVIALHGGTIRVVDSDNGQGTVIEMWLEAPGKRHRGWSEPPETPAEPRTLVSTPA